MTKTFCDVCGGEVVRREDLRYVSIIDEAGNPVMAQQEVCSQCGMNIKEIISAGANRVEVK